MTWHARRKGWMGPFRAAAPTPAPLPPDQDPPAQVQAVVIVPAFPCFSPPAVAALLREPRSTVQYWLDNGKLDSYMDNVGGRYVLRAELIRFVRDYLRRVVHE